MGLPPPQKRDGRRVAATMRRQAKGAATAAAATQAAQVATEKAKEVKPAAKKVRAKAVLARQADAKWDPTAAEYKARDMLNLTITWV